ncbi:MAG: ribosome recycling factor [Acidobacteria bacterium]|nr:ribosome recycling factor [Acidobacteriota bacterium]
MELNQLKSDTDAHMKATLEDARRKFQHIRTGRASVNLLDTIMVDYYGSMTPLSQVAAISAPEPSLLTVQPWDPSVIKAIEKAILTSDLNLNPSNDGKMVRIPIPQLTEERRKQLVRVVHDITEEHRTAIRNIRRDANDKLKAALKDKTISEDDERRALEEVQKMTDSYIAKLNDLGKQRENEVMTV